LAGFELDRTRSDPVGALAGFIQGRNEFF